jgi:hypothetical protein
VPESNVRVDEVFADRYQPDTGKVDAIRRRIAEIDRAIDRAADRLLSAPDDLMDVLAPKLSGMKKDRERLLTGLRSAEIACGPVDVESEARARVERLWTLTEEIQEADPARVRELLRNLVSRIELHFEHVQRGKRLECPFSHGEIQLNPAMFSCASRGDWRCTFLNDVNVQRLLWRVIAQTMQFSADTFFALGELPGAIQDS